MVMSFARLLPEMTTFRVRSDLNAFTSKIPNEVVIPPGSTIEWQKGDYASGMASVFWLRRRVLVVEAELFGRCERLNQPNPREPKLTAPCA
jgi:hypothetical protein